MFDAALTHLRLPAARCAVVGDSEVNDIRPGRLLGCTTVRVAILEPLPLESEADAVLGSLDDVARELLR
jgi:FMN phosphatase YigB (HAD superfamily)